MFAVCSLVTITAFIAPAFLSHKIDYLKYEKKSKRNDSY